MAIGALPQTCGAADASSAPVAWIRAGQAGYIGPDLGVDLHSASVGVLTIGLDAPLVVETGAHGTLVTRSVYAPARAAHRVVASEGRILLLFSDSDGPAAAMRDFAGPYGLGHRAERELIAACRDDPEPDLLRALAGPVPLGGDPRVRRVVGWMREDPAKVLHAEQSAYRVGLSTPHFLRLFARHTGTTFRRYQQWNRLLEAARGIAVGHSLTRCAADAGFASPSHLSDTFHETLGTTASAVLGSRVQFEVDG
jgi:AraC-like DNA-binding protein